MEKADCYSHLFLFLSDSDTRNNSKLGKKVETSTNLGILAALISIWLFEAIEILQYNSFLQEKTH
jgi:hypothetical protein